MRRYFPACLCTYHASLKRKHHLKEKEEDAPESNSDR